jgi:hypothetical protein
MRGSYTALLGLLLGDVALAAAHDRLYTYDAADKTRPIHRNVFDGDIARLIVERRLRSSEVTSLGNVDDDTIALIDGFGGRQPVLFEDAKPDPGVERLLIICEWANLSQGVLIVLWKQFGVCLGSANNVRNRFTEYHGKEQFDLLPVDFL